MLRAQVWPQLSKYNSATHFAQLKVDWKHSWPCVKQLIIIIIIINIAFMCECSKFSQSQETTLNWSNSLTVFVDAPTVLLFEFFYHKNKAVAK